MGTVTDHHPCPRESTEKNTRKEERKMCHPSQTSPNPNQAWQGVYPDLSAFNDLFSPQAAPQPNPYQGMYMNGNRYYQQQHNPSQGYYDRPNNNSNEESNGFIKSNERSHYYKYNNNQPPSSETTNFTSTAGNGNRNRYPPQDKSMDDHQLKYYNDYKPNELDMFSHFSNSKIPQEGSSGGGSYSGSGAETSGAYEEDFPELTTAKFSQLRLDSEDVSPINHVPSLSSNKDFCF